MAALIVTPSNVSTNDNERGSFVSRYTTGEAIVLGSAVYLDSNNLAWNAKSDSSAHANAIGIAAIADNFYGETTVPTGGVVGVVVSGPVWGFSGMSQGQVAWIGATPGQIVDTAPTGGAYQFQIGRAIDAETIFVDPGTASPVSHA